MNNLDELIERRGLLKYISPNVGNIDILVIDSLSYLDELHELLPAANFTLLSTVDVFKNNNENFFDIIVAEDLLTYTDDPYKSATKICRQLKQTGFLVTQFESVRFIGVLESLRQGYFPVRERRLYAKTEIVRLLNDSLFKEISFVPDIIVEADIKDWINFGFDNFNNELLVKNWIVKASRSKAEVAALKQFYTSDIRKELARILHRIEYDIDREENIIRLKNLCQQHQIFDDYLIDFIDSIVVHKKIFENLPIFD